MWRLLLCLAAGPALGSPMTNIVLFDFKAADAAAGREWQIVNDDVMGGVSASRLVVTNGTAVFTGQVSLENNGGFASVRSAPGALDLRGISPAAQHVVIRVRGDGKTYKFTARSDRSWDSVLYQAAFTTRAGEWSEHSFSVRELTPTFRGRVLREVPALSPEKIVSVGFLISDKQAGPFRLELERIKLVP